MRITADLRVLEGESAPEAIAAAESAAAARRDIDLALAQALLEIDAKRAYIAQGCSSTLHFGKRLGLETAQTRRLLRLGRAIAACPELLRRVVGGRVTSAAAAELGPLFEYPEGRDDYPYWLECAEREAFAPYRKSVRKRLAEIRCGEPVVEVAVHVPERVREKLDRAREVASRKKRRFLTDGETIEAALDHFLESFDPLLQGEGTRRVGPTDERPGERYVPVQVQRVVRRRAEDRCEYPGCPKTTFLQFAHLRPHREGSGREESDLVLLCWVHHLMLDGGFLTVFWREEEPVFVGEDGDVRTRGASVSEEDLPPEELALVQALRASRGPPPAEDPRPPDSGPRPDSGPQPAAA